MKTSMIGSLRIHQLDRAEVRTMRPTLLALAACAVAAAAPDASEVQTRLEIDATYADTVKLVVDSISTYEGGDDVGLVDKELLLWMTVRNFNSNRCYRSSNIECTNLQNLAHYLVNDKRASPTKVVNWSQQSTIELVFQLFKTYIIPDAIPIFQPLFTAVKNLTECNGFETPNMSLGFAIRTNPNFAKILLEYPCTSVNPNLIIMGANRTIPNDELLTMLVTKATASDVEVAVADPQFGEYIERILQQTDYPNKTDIIAKGGDTRASLTQTIIELGHTTLINNGILLAKSIAGLNEITLNVHALIEHLNMTRNLYMHLSEEALNDLESPFTKYAVAHFPNMLPKMIMMTKFGSLDLNDLLPKLFQIKEIASISPVTACKNAMDIIPLGMTDGWGRWPEDTNALPELWQVMQKVCKKFDLNFNSYKNWVSYSNEAYYTAFLLAVHDEKAIEKTTEDDVRAFLHKHRRVIKKMMLPVGSTEDARTFIVDGVNNMKGIKKHDSTAKPPVPNVPRPNTKSNGTRSLEKCMSAVHAAALVLALALIF